MIYAIVPDVEGMPDIDFQTTPPIESIITDTQRYCVFQQNVTFRPSWTEITEAEYAAIKAQYTPEPEPVEPTT